MLFVRRGARGETAGQEVRHMVAHADDRAVPATVRFAAVVAVCPGFAVGAGFPILPGVPLGARFTVSAGFTVWPRLTLWPGFAVGAGFAAVGRARGAVFADALFAGRRRRGGLGLGSFDFHRGHVTDRLTRGFAAMIADGAVAVAALAAFRATLSR